MNPEPMKYLALEFDLKHRRIRVGSCVSWAIVAIVLAFTKDLGPWAHVTNIVQWWTK